MATCSSIDEPVFVFQFPEMDVRLLVKDILRGNVTTANQLATVSVWGLHRHSHVSFVIVANLLDADVVLGVDERLRCGVSLGQCHNAGNVLKVILTVHFNLSGERPKPAN